VFAGEEQDASARAGVVLRCLFGLPLLGCPHLSAGRAVSHSLVPTRVLSPGPASRPLTRPIGWPPASLDPSPGSQEGAVTRKWGRSGRVGCLQKGEEYSESTRPGAPANLIPPIPSKESACLFTLETYRRAVRAVAYHCDSQRVLCQGRRYTRSPKPHAPEEPPRLGPSITEVTPGGLSENSSGVCLLGRFVGKRLGCHRGECPNTCIRFVESVP